MLKAALREYPCRRASGKPIFGMRRFRALASEPLQAARSRSSSSTRSRAASSAKSPLAPPCRERSLKLAARPKISWRALESGRMFRAKRKRSASRRPPPPAPSSGDILSLDVRSFVLGASGKWIAILRRSSAACMKSRRKPSPVGMLWRSLIGLLRRTAGPQPTAPKPASEPSSRGAWSANLSMRTPLWASNAGRHPALPFRRAILEDAIHARAADLERAGYLSRPHPALSSVSTSSAFAPAVVRLRTPRMLRAGLPPMSCPGIEIVVPICATLCTTRAQSRPAGKSLSRETWGFARAVTEDHL